MKTEQNLERNATATQINDHIPYGIIKEEYSTNSGCRTSYGIVAYDDGDNDCVLAAVHDITVSKQAISRLVSLCNGLELSYIHLNDVVEDFLASRQLV